MLSAAYSRFVTILRIALPLVILGLIALVLIWPRLQSEWILARTTLPEIDPKTIEQAIRENRLTGADFSSTDSQGRPYTIQAQEAYTDQARPQDVLLKSPRARLQNDATTTLLAAADLGRYDQTRKTLTLQSNVTLDRETKAGLTRLRTQRLDLYLDQGQAQAPLTVFITAPNLTIEAKSAQAFQNGDHLIFYGPVKAVIQEQ